MSDLGFKIDLSESFEHLPNAPIVEAIIHWRARAEGQLEPDVLLEQLKAKLPDYPNPQRQQKLDVGAEFGPDGTAFHQRHNWHGFRFECQDKLHVAQFTRNGFVFSRLKPYEDWEQLEAEAKRLWQVYYKLVEVSEIQRLGVRFINRITPVEPNQLAEQLAMPPRSPDSMELPLIGFMHQNTFDIPQYPYSLNAIQTIQPPSPPETASSSVILDLDVITTRPIQFDEIDSRLLEMRWIKNKAFFSFLTNSALVRFRR